MIELNARPARRNTLAETVYTQILEQIVSGRFTAGDKLPSEAELSLAFDVSRPVVRQALLRLQTDGLVQARKGIGTFVSTTPSKRLSELTPIADLAGYLRSFEPRIVLEVEAARFAALRRTQGHLIDLRETIEALRAAILRGELGQAEDVAFHEAVARAADNDHFVHMLEALRAPIEQTMGIGLELARDRVPIRRQRVVEEHLHIYDAIAAEDPEGAMTYMRYHLFQARANLIDTHHLEYASGLGQS
jgi:DNA-binding FadR family transcriptional regulator